MKEFRNFFTNILIQDENWVTNSHFIIKKNGLTKAQLKFLNDDSFNEAKIKELYDGVVKQREDKKPIRQFIGRFILVDYCEGTITEDDTNLIDTGLRKDYYKWFTKKGYEFHYITERRCDPLGIFKNGEFMGILLPVKINTNDYNLEYQIYLNN